MTQTHKLTQFNMHPKVVLKFFSVFKKKNFNENLFLDNALLNAKIVSSLNTSLSDTVVKSTLLNSDSIDSSDVHKTSGKHTSTELYSKNNSIIDKNVSIIRKLIYGF